MDKSFTGKRILVTGAGQGIGRATAIALSKHGAEVIALSRTLCHLETLKQEVPSIKIVQLDISDWNNTFHTVRTLLPIDMLVNNAAVACVQPFGEVTEDEFDKIFAVNVKAALNIAQVVANDLKSRKQSGSIVNISSQASLVAIQDHTTYGASKAALDSLTKVMALELGPHQIRVNSVNPTVVLTEMGKVGWSKPEKAKAAIANIPLGKFCEPEDVVNVILFLLSSKSGMITGACLPVDGGWTIH